MKRNEVVMSMLTLQVPTRVCEAVFRSLGVKAAEHYLTRQKDSKGGSDCAVVIWGAEVDPETLAIIPCSGDQLLAQLDLWQRIYDWSQRNNGALDASDLALSQADRAMLDSTNKLYFIMNCSPNRSSLEAMRKRVNRCLKDTMNLLESSTHCLAVLKQKRKRDVAQRRVSAEQDEAVKILIHAEQQQAKSLQEEIVRLRHLVVLLNRHRHATIRLHVEPVPVLQQAIGDWPARMLVGITEAELLQAGNELALDYCGNSVSASWHSGGADGVGAPASRCGCASCVEHVQRTSVPGMGWSM